MERPGVVSPDREPQSGKRATVWAGPTTALRGNVERQANPMAVELKLRRRTTFSKARNRKLTGSRKDLVKETGSGRELLQAAQEAPPYPTFGPQTQDTSPRPPTAPPHWF